MAEDPGLLTRRIYETLTRLVPDGAPRVRLWDGSTLGPSGAPSTLVLTQPGSLRAMLLPPTDLTAGEAYVFDDIDIEGDIFSLMEWAAKLETLKERRMTAFGVWRQLRRLPSDHRRHAADRPRFGGRLHSVARDREAVSYHYDAGNEFYRLFLGETMVYSCAYFLQPTDSLDTAQIRKLDLVCRKLGLGQGDRFLDVGCGWGSLAVHAAEHYGVEALGVTVSEEQARYAEDWAKHRGLDDRVRFVVDDYRNLPGQFDAVASIGMFEHVGRKRLPEYFATCRRLVAPGGRFLNHGITTNTRSAGRTRPTFVSTYVFPDGELEPVELITGEAEAAGFETRDVESLRMSYARTLRHWVTNLERSHDDAAETSSERTYRIWRAYMAGSSVAFASGAIAVYQMLLCDRRTPWTYGRRGLLASDDR